MHNATGTGRGGEGQEAVVEAVFRLPHDPLSFMSFYASVSVCVCVCSVCTHHLVWFAKHSRGKKLRQRESEKGGGGRRGDHAKERQLQRAQAEGQPQAGTAYSCASSIRNFTHYAVPTSAGPDRSKATPKQKKKKKKQQRN